MHIALTIFPGDIEKQHEKHFMLNYPGAQYFNFNYQMHMLTLLAIPLYISCTYSAFLPLPRNNTLWLDTQIYR